MDKESMLGLSKSIVGDMLGSKKFIALITGIVANIVVLAASKFGVSEDQAAGVATQITGLVASYVVGQGIADAGKEKAKIEASNAKSAVEATTSE